MTNILFKSRDQDLSKILSILDTLQKNVLYITYRVDKVLIKVNSLSVNDNLQKQVDQYFDEDETSPQTDNEYKTGTDLEDK